MASNDSNAMLKLLEVFKSTFLEVFSLQIVLRHTKWTHKMIEFPSEVNFPQGGNKNRILKNKKNLTKGDHIWNLAYLGLTQHTFKLQSVFGQTSYTALITYHPGGISKLSMLATCLLWDIMTILACILVSLYSPFNFADQLS